jgi:hypothetical protein
LKRDFRFWSQAGVTIAPDRSEKLKPLVQWWPGPKLSRHPMAEPNYKRSRTFGGLLLIVVGLFAVLHIRYYETHGLPLAGRQISEPYWKGYAHAAIVISVGIYCLANRRKTFPPLNEEKRDEGTVD